MIAKIINLVFGVLVTVIIPLGLLKIGIYIADKQNKK
jgi:hypothetical protein